MCPILPGTCWRRGEGPGYYKHQEFSLCTGHGTSRVCAMTVEKRPNPDRASVSMSLLPLCIEAVTQWHL